MMRQVVLLIALAFCGAPLLAQDGTRILTDSKIQAVTVFTDRAMVKRSIEGSFRDGFVTIEVPRLPSGLIDESVRVSGRGSAGAKISGVKIEQALAGEGARERIGEIEDQIAVLDDRVLELKDRTGVLEQKKAFIKSLSEKTGESIAGNLPTERPSVAEWAGMLNFVDEGLEAINRENRAIAAEIEDIELKRQMLQTSLGEIRGGGSKTEKKAVINVDIERPGDFSFELSYMIMGAGWKPYYDVRAWSDTNEIELVYMANVNQQTGEDWENVKLELSTARPSAGANPPMLYTWYLSPDMPVMDVVTGGKMYSRGGRQQYPNPFNAPFPAMEQVTTQYNTAETVDQGVSTTFSIRQRESIPSNKEFKKVPVKTISFVAAEEYITVPRASETVYLKSAITNATDIPLLAGPANVFYDNNYVSSGTLPLVLPKEDFNLYFGADEGIKVKRELVEKLRDDAGITGSKERIRYEYKITLQNFHKSDRKVTVVDQVPVSQDDKIDVKLGKIVPEPNYIAGDQQKGFVRWVATLKPQEKTQFTFGYEVKYPQEMALGGLE